MKIGFASDHRGYELKEKIKEKISSKYEIIDYGTNSKESVDYPDFAFKLGEGINKKEVNFGVAICGSGIGISIACNKVKNIRCAKVINKEEAKITRIDNDSNIIAFGEKTNIDDAIEMIDIFVNTKFSNLDKHKRRINKIKDYEEK